MFILVLLESASFAISESERERIFSSIWTGFVAGAGVEVPKKPVDAPGAGVDAPKKSLLEVAGAGAGVLKMSFEDAAGVGAGVLKKSFPDDAAGAAKGSLAGAGAANGSLAGAEVPNGSLVGAGVAAGVSKKPVVDGAGAVVPQSKSAIEGGHKTLGKRV